MVLLALLLVAPVEAGPIFASVEPELTIGMAGTWSRFHPVTDGFWFFQGAGGDYWAAHVEDDLSGFNDQERIKLTDNGQLQDNQVERCDDGGWLVAGSYTLDTHDDSSAVWRLDEDFGLIERFVIEERAPEREHNDPVVLCSELATGIAAADAQHRGSTFVDVSGDTPIESFLPEWNSMGGSMAVRASDNRIIAAGVNDPRGSSSISITVYDADFEEESTTEFTTPQGASFWPQRLLPFGDGWVLAYLDFSEIPGAGEVWLAALDADFALVDSIQITDNGSADGRPWVVRKGDTLVVSYDRDIQPRAALVRLQPDAVPENDGLLDTANSANDSGDGADPAGDPLADCACGTSTGTHAALLAPILLYARRRRRS